MYSTERYSLVPSSTRSIVLSRNSTSMKASNCARQISCFSLSEGGANVPRYCQQSMMLRSKVMARRANISVKPSIVSNAGMCPCSFIVSFIPSRSVKYCFKYQTYRQNVLQASPFLPLLSPLKKLWNIALQVLIIVPLQSKISASQAADFIMSIVMEKLWLHSTWQMWHDFLDGRKTTESRKWESNSQLAV